MPVIKTITGIKSRLLIFGLIIPLIFSCMASCDDRQTRKSGTRISSAMADSVGEVGIPGENDPVYAMLVSPKNPGPGQPFRILTTGGKNIRKSKIILSGLSGSKEPLKSITGEGLPWWRIDDFAGSSPGEYRISLITDKKVVRNLEFSISSENMVPATGVVWRTIHGWDSCTEALYSAWINALFYGFNERVSWPALDEVTRNQNRNFLYNHLSLGEDDPDGKNRVIMQPDCADNPFFLRAYFAWKLGLPFGYHVCDRGSPGHNPKTGRWITNETAGPKTHPVTVFNAFLLRLKDGVHSGTARTALADENSDYYPVPLKRETLRPGIVFADPYGHTLIIIGWVPQTNGHPGELLSVDAQPDGTVGIKRFWKGNFLFNTANVIGEPGFKAFRPISFTDGVPGLIRNKELTGSPGFIPFSLQQKNMGSDVFYHTMERLINPKPLDPVTALLDLIHALHEQLMVRITSVDNGEAYFKSHPGSVIPMPSGAAGVFLAGGQWEAFSTPNRDLRLLIAMDAVLGFPEQVFLSPEDFNISGLVSPEQLKNKLQSVLDKKVSGLSISYTRTDGSLQKLTIGEILERKDAFEMAYNPNDGPEIRWGAPENSEEWSACNRHAPSGQVKTMRLVRKWFQQRLHPPT